MNTLGTRHKKKGPNIPGENNNIPVMLRDNSEEISLGKALFISTIAHPAVVAFLWLLAKGLLLLLAILGITLPIFNKPEPKMKDIEFVLVDRAEQTPINKKTRFRADRNTRAGGKHDPTRPISQPEPQSRRSTPQKAAAQSKASPQKKMSQPKQQTHKSAAKPKSSSQNNTPVPPRPRPTNTYPKPRASKNNIFSIPIPKAKSIGPMSPRGGPVTSGPIGDSSPSDNNPSPVMSSGNYSSASKGRRASGYSLGGGNAGNPGPGNPNGRPGIDALREPDFGPYMSELTRRIKRNWHPPRGDESKHVVLIFRISKDGRLVFSRVKQSSGSTEADIAAKAAVELSAPFRPLPPEYRQPSVDIDFTFDYNVVGVTGRRY